MKLKQVLAAMAVATLLISGAGAQQQEEPAAAPDPVLELVPRARSGQDPAPATTQATKISPEAAAIVSKVAGAYAKLKSLDLVGKLRGEFDVDGQKKDEKAEFTSSFAAPNIFRHEMKDEELVGSTGEKLYVYVKNTNLYLMMDAPKGKFLSADLPDPFPDLITGQNLSLVLALSSDPSAELTKSYGQVSKADDVKIDDKPYTALALTDRKDGPTATLLIDPQTNLVRRAVLDFSANAVAQGASDVKKAVVTIDYVDIKPDATTRPSQFAWAPPAGAKDMAKADVAAISEPAMELKGKPAPAFKLKGMDDKEVSLADVKGKVVVLDFWATWCGPCVMSLPKLQMLYEQKKGDDVKFFAINQREEKQTVADFVKSSSLGVPVLLDSEGKATEAYKADAIPETVVIGKDGVIKAVIVGAFPESEKELQDAVEAAMKAK